MTETCASQSTVIRTERGLSIAGTRITLYQIMDYLEADWPPSLIQSWLNLTDEQITDAMDYIENHREEVKAEYESVLQRAGEIREYWDAYNQKRFEEIASMPPKPGQEEIRAKLREWKERLEPA